MKVELQGRVTRVADCYDERCGDTHEVVVDVPTGDTITITGISRALELGPLYGNRVRLVLEVIR